MLTHFVPGSACGRLYRMSNRPTKCVKKIVCHSHALSDTLIRISTPSAAALNRRKCAPSASMRLMHTNGLFD